MKYLVSAPVEYTDKNGEKKTTWVRLGMAFEAKDGDGFVVKLNALPIGNTLLIKEDKGPQDYKRKAGRDDKPRGNGYPKDQAQQSDADDSY